ncbi:MAG: DUF4199 domain-containing protein [Bacteroidota bacterium]
MWKKGITFGLIGGAIVVLSMLIPIALFSDLESLSFTRSELFGYTIMAVALSTIFFGIRSYRDHELGGRITFGKALVMGLLIAAIAGVLYTTGWMILSPPDFMEQYAQQYLENLKSDGATEVEIQAAMEEIAQSMEIYKNPFFKAGITFMEIFPVGLIISLISALILKKTDPAPEKELV